MLDSSFATKLAVSKGRQMLGNKNEVGNSAPKIELIRQPESTRVSAPGGFAHDDHLAPSSARLVYGVEETKEADGHSSSQTVGPATFASSRAVADDAAPQIDPARLDQLDAKIDIVHETVRVIHETIQANQSANESHLESLDAKVEALVSLLTKRLVVVSTDGDDEPTGELE